MLCVDNQDVTCLSSVSSSFAVDKVTRKYTPLINSSTDTLSTKKLNCMRNKNLYLFKCVKQRFCEQSESKVIFYTLTDRLHIFWSTLLSSFSSFYLAISSISFLVLFLSEQTIFSNKNSLFLLLFYYWYIFDIHNVMLVYVMP